MTKTLDGRSSISDKTSSTPPFPRTFPISCGSMTSPVVPCLVAAIAKWASVNILDSKWTCPSIKPGETNFPVISIVFVSSPILSEMSPMPTIIPSFTATSPLRISFVLTLIILPPVSARSALISPFPAKIRFCKLMIPYTSCDLKTFSQNPKNRPHHVFQGFSTRRNFFIPSLPEAVGRLQVPGCRRVL